MNFNPFAAFWCGWTIWALACRAMLQAGQPADAEILDFEAERRARRVWR